MASEFIAEILKTEDECKMQESEAKKLAEEKKLRAKDDAAKLIADAKKQVEIMLRDDAAAVANSSEQRMIKERVNVQKECDELSARAKRNTDRVTKLVAKAITE